MNCVLETTPMLDLKINFTGSSKNDVISQPSLTPVIIFYLLSLPSPFFSLFCCYLRAIIHAWKKNKSSPKQSINIFWKWNNRTNIFRMLPSHFMIFMVTVPLAITRDFVTKDIILNDRLLRLYTSYIYHAILYDNIKNMY